MSLPNVAAFLAETGKSLLLGNGSSVDGLAYRQRINSWPILNGAGVDVGFTFNVHYFPKNPDEYSLTIQYPRMVWRIACNPRAAVSNKRSEIVGIPNGRIRGRHYFSWDDNAHMILEEQNTVNHLCFARPLHPNLVTFEQITTWLFGVVNIDLPNWTFKPTGLI